MLPQNLLEGEWIWLQEACEHPDNHVFFRRSFVLDETPGTAELWISARTFFHVYINERHFAYGPVPSPDGTAYALRLDVAYLLETGINVISVHAHNTSVSRVAHRRQWSGMWCQLLIDGSTFLSTDRQWLCQFGSCFTDTPVRRSPAEAFIENVDLRDFPEDWHSGTAANDRWRSPDISCRIEDCPESIVDAVLPEFTSSFIPHNAVTRRGTCELTAAGTEIRFTPLADSAGEGVYAAEAYIFSDNDQQVTFFLYSDHPFRLILNDEIIKEQGVPELRNTMDPVHHHPVSFGQCPITQPEGRMQLVAEQWNRILLFQHVEYESGPTTLIFPDHASDELVVREEPVENAKAGWTLRGPLQTPLAFANPVVDFGSRNMPSTTYTPSEYCPFDVSAHLVRYTFNAGDETEKKNEQASLTLQQNQYVVLDLGAVKTGCPEVNIQGEENDTLDIITGSHLPEQDHALSPVYNEKRRTESLILGESPTHWIFTAPRGFRYIMIIARNIKETVEIVHAGVRVLDFFYETTSGDFTSSDSTVDNIWKTSVRTLSTCTAGHFYDAPDAIMVQHLPDAMIQSWSSYLALGEYAVPERNIRDFAKTQLETGHIPAVNGGDTLQFYIDDALCWPIWLQRHYMYTGAQEFLESMIPHLKRLFSLLAWEAPEGLDVLAITKDLPSRNLLAGTRPLQRGDIGTGINALYCRSLLCAAWLCDQAHAHSESETAIAWRKRAARVASQLRTMNWDEEKGLFSEAYRNGKPLDNYTWQANVSAIYGGVARAQNYESIMNASFRKEPPYTALLDGGEPSPFMMFLTVETASALGERTWGLDMMIDKWSRMLRDAAGTWPNPPLDATPDSTNRSEVDASECYGINALPAAIFLTELAGIRPATPGLARVFFEPILDHPACNRVYTRIPTLHGNISLKWEIDENKNLQVSLDSGFPLEVVPNLDPHVSREATFHVSDEVKITTPA